MSRGLGKIQRAVLEVFENNPKKGLDSIVVTGLVFDKTEVNDSECVSVRRALRSLVKSELLLDMGRGFRQGRRQYALPEYYEEYRERVNTVFGKKDNIDRPLIFQ